MILFVFILIIILLIFYLIGVYWKENFISCDRIPSGPYKTKCTNIKFNNNILYALCPTQEPENVFISSKLDLTDCIKDQNDCNSINIDSGGNLTCE